MSSSQTFDVLFTLSAPAAQITISQVMAGLEQVVHTSQNVGAGPVSIPVTFAAGGNTGVRVVASASNGGFTAAERSLFLDQVPLTAQWQLADGQIFLAHPDTVELEFSDLLLDDSDLLAAVQLLYNGLPISTSGLSIVPMADRAMHCWV
ncbi:MAG: hypothetical protein IPG69_11105 [Flavobacteriales bacterium]|nr:hypothetical protein [Flavobacteriales bacterium]